MTSSKRRLVLQLALATLVVGVAALTAFSSSAHALAYASDSARCGKPYWHPGQLYHVQRCPLWRGSVPVYSDASGRTVVGYLRMGGMANWFFANRRIAMTQIRGRRIDIGRRWNTWWIQTVADNGRDGWVNEVYFAGNDNDQPDAGIDFYLP